MSTKPHPSLEQLVAYARGQVSPTLAKALAEHLARCVNCEATFVVSRREGDTLSAREQQSEEQSKLDLSQFGEYQLLKKLGEGGMAAVYMGESSGRAVLFPQSYAGGRRRQRRWRVIPVVTPNVVSEAGSPPTILSTGVQKMRVATAMTELS